MSEESSYKDGEIVWVKLNNRWRPAEVCDDSRLPPNLFSSIRKKPIAFVKFFEEEAFECVRNLNNIASYNCEKKNEFIKKGLDLYRANHKYMIKFPTDIEIAEERTNGDLDILNREEFMDGNRPNNFGMHEDSSRKGRKPLDNDMTEYNTPPQKGIVTKIFEKAGTSGGSRREIVVSTTPTTPGTGMYKCHLCNFTSNRQNVIVLHTKNHRNVPLPSPPIQTPPPPPKPKGEPKSILKNKIRPIIRPSTSKAKDITGDEIDDDSENDVETRKTTVPERTARCNTPIPFKAAPRTGSNNNKATRVTAKKSPNQNEKTESKHDNEMRSKILADWGDFESDSDDSNIESATQQKVDGVEENSNSALSSTEPTRLGPLVQLIKSAEAKANSKNKNIAEQAAQSINEPGTSTPKYRNIPKKDRRDIVLMDFHNGDLLTAKNNAQQDPLSENAENFVKEVENSAVSVTGDIAEEVTPSESLSPQTAGPSNRLSEEDESEIILEVTTEVPEVTTEVPEVTTEVPEVTTEVPEDTTEVPEVTVEVPEVSTEIPEVTTEVPEVTTEVPEVTTEVPEVTTEIPEVITEIPIPTEIPVDSPVRENPVETEPEQVTVSPEEDVQDSSETRVEQVKEINKPSPPKPSMSCFDFQDEDDGSTEILTSLRKLKEKYRSPDKYKDNADGEGNSQADEAKIEIQKKDEMLSAEIENLLNCTKVPEIKIDVKSSKSENFNSDTVSPDVRALPPKERGKRIFKSRNRSRYEETNTCTPIDTGPKPLLTQYLKASEIKMVEFSTISEVEVETQKSKETELDNPSPKDMAVDLEQSKEPEIGIEESNEVEVDMQLTKESDTDKIEEVAQSNKIEEDAPNENTYKPIEAEIVVLLSKETETEAPKITESSMEISVSEQLDIVTKPDESEIHIQKSKETDMEIPTSSTITEHTSTNSENDNLNKDHEEISNEITADEENERTNFLSSSEQIDNNVEAENLYDHQLLEEEQSNIAQNVEALLEKSDSSVYSTEEASQNLQELSNITESTNACIESDNQAYMHSEVTYEQENSAEVQRSESPVIQLISQEEPLTYIEQTQLPSNIETSENLTDDSNTNNNKENINESNNPILTKDSQDFESKEDKSLTKSQGASSLEPKTSDHNDFDQHTLPTCDKEIEGSLELELDFSEEGTKKQKELDVAEALISIPTKLSDSRVYRDEEAPVSLVKTGDVSLELDKRNDIDYNSTQNEDVSKTKASKSDEENPALSNLEYQVSTEVINFLSTQEQVLKQTVQQPTNEPPAVGSRKRRAHMKFTPRKRVLQTLVTTADVQTSTTIVEKVNNENSNTNQTSSTSTTPSVSPPSPLSDKEERSKDVQSPSYPSPAFSPLLQTEETTERNSNEGCEDSFVQKYIKDAMMFASNEDGKPNRRESERLKRRSADVKEKSEGNEVLQQSEPLNTIDASREDLERTENADSNSTEITKGTETFSADHISTTTLSELQLNIQQKQNENDPKAVVEIIEINTSEKNEEKVKSSKETIIEMRSFRFRKRNLKSDNTKPPAQETSKKNDTTESSPIQEFIEKSGEEIEVSQQNTIFDRNELIITANAPEALPPEAENFSQDIEITKIIDTESQLQSDVQASNDDHTEKQVVEFSREITVELDVGTLEKLSSDNSNIIENITNVSKTISITTKDDRKPKTCAEILSQQATEMMQYPVYQKLRKTAARKGNEPKMMQEPLTRIYTPSGTIDFLMKTGTEEISAKPENIVSPLISQFKNDKYEARIPKKRKQTFEEEIPSFMIEKHTNPVSNELQQPPEKMTKTDSSMVQQKSEQKVEIIKETPMKKQDLILDFSNVPTVLAINPKTINDIIEKNNTTVMFSKTTKIIPQQTIVTTSPPPVKNPKTKGRKPYTPRSASINKSTPDITSMASQSPETIPHEGKKVGTDGKGNKFVIIKTGNSAKMIIQPDTPRTVSEPSQNDFNNQTIAMNKTIAKLPNSLKLSVTKSITLPTRGAQVFITSKGNIIPATPPSICSISKSVDIVPVTQENQLSYLPKSVSSNKRGSKYVKTPLAMHTPEPPVKRGRPAAIKDDNSLNNKFIIQSQLERQATTSTNVRQDNQNPLNKITDTNRVGFVEETIEPVKVNPRPRPGRPPKNSLRARKNKIDIEEHSTNLTVMTETAATNVSFNDIQMQQLQQQLQIQQQQQQQQQDHQQQQMEQHLPQMQIQPFQPQTTRLSKRKTAKEKENAPAIIQTLVTNSGGQVQSDTNLTETSVTDICDQSENLAEANRTIVDSNTIACANNLIGDLTAKYGDGSLLAVPAESFGGPSNAFYLCTVADNDQFVPIDHQPLYLDPSNQLLPIIPEAETSNSDKVTTLQEAHIVVETTTDGSEQILTDLSQISDPSSQSYLINTAEGHQILLDQQSLLALVASGGDGAQLVTPDGQQLVLPPELLSAISINQGNDIGGNQILLSEAIDSQMQTGNQDILAAALAGTEVYQQEQLIGDVLQIETSNVQIVEQGISFQPLNQPVQAVVSETNAILTQPPIMSALEAPSKNKSDPTTTTNNSNGSGLIAQNLDDSLAVIGVTTQQSAVPSSLELPITVTNPAIAAKSTASPITLGGIYAAGLSQSSQISPTLSTISGNDQEQLSYDLFTSSSLQQPNSSPSVLSHNCAVVQNSNVTNEIIIHHNQPDDEFSNNQQQQITEFPVQNQSNNGASAYDDPTR